MLSLVLRHFGRLDSSNDMIGRFFTQRCGLQIIHVYIGKSRLTRVTTGCRFRRVFLARVGVLQSFVCVCADISHIADA